MSTFIKPLWNDFKYLDHQIYGIQWMLNRERAKDASIRGGILADEMGLGKTIQMMGLIKNGVTGFQQQTLLIVPVAVMAQWKAIIHKCGMTVCVANKTATAWVTEGEVKSALAPRICIIGYEMANAHKDIVLGFDWYRCIYDEAHRLASMSTSGEVAKKIKTDHMWFLTATPIINGISDLLHLFQIHGQPFKVGAQAQQPELLHTYILSRTMEQLRAVLPGAPPKPVQHVQLLEFKTEEEANFYRSKADIITAQWDSLEGKGGLAAEIERLKLFMRLRQLSLHPQIYINARKGALGSLAGANAFPDWRGSSTKFEALRDLVKAEPGRKWIMFCHFRTEMELLRELFKAETCVGRVGIYNGDLSHKQKAAVIEESFAPLEDGKSEVLLVQLQSGGVGLNLQHFDRIAFTGPWWTKALMDQAIGRAVRIGQKEVVHVYHLRLKEEEQINIDTIMMDKADSKGELCRKVLEKADTTIA